MKKHKYAPFTSHIRNCDIKLDVVQFVRQILSLFALIEAFYPETVKMDYISVQTNRNEPENALDTNPQIPDYNCFIIHEKQKRH